MTKAERVFLKVYGCKVNQYELQLMREGLMREGYEVVSQEDEADYTVVNTCTVTAGSDKELEYWIRRLKRINPKVRVLLAGCYVANHRDKIAENGLVDGVIEARNKEFVPQLLRRYSDENHKVFSNELPREKVIPLGGISFFSGRTRAFVKVQDGCNKVCSFCIVTIVRGPVRSRQRQEIKEEVSRLAFAGYREVVLTGVQVGAYGQDRQEKGALAELIQDLADIPNLERIRLSSIDPLYVRKELIRTMEEVSKFCPHLHISLQSGDDHILKVMRRGHDTAMFAGLLDQLHQRIPNFAWSTDMIVGFPGESLAAFENSSRFLERYPPMKVHVFPYSDRKGTAAVDLSDKIELAEKRRRVQAMLEVAGRCFDRAAERMVGEEGEVLLEKESHDDLNRELSGRLPNYFPVRVRMTRKWASPCVPVRIKRVGKNYLAGDLIEKPAHLAVLS